VFGSSFSSTRQATTKQPQSQGLSVGFVLLRVESLVEEGKL